MAAQHALEQAVTMMASHMEANIDRELTRLDNLNEDDLDKIRQQRMADMRKRQEKSKEWAAKGHGEYQEVQSEQDFFKAMKGEERMICHFYRENWPCKVMDKHMAAIARKHLETKVVKINAEKSPFLTERLKIWMLPTLALIKNEKVEDYIVGFQDFGNTDDFETDVLEQRLAKSEMLDYEWPAQRPKALAGPAKALRKGGVDRTGSDEDSDFD
ncbi:thioredoxin-like protein [Haematococcus lacustris]